VTSGEIRKPKYDGLTVLLPNVGSLRAGDILLTFNGVSEDRKGSKQSDAIRRATGGTFSHAMICSAPPTFVEAVGPGVSTLSLQRCFAHNWDNIRLLRFPETSIAMKAAQLAQLEVGRDYSIPRAVASVLPQYMVEQITDNGIFCSALIAQVFTAAGAIEFGESLIAKTTPATIERMACLEDVTSEVFSEGLAPNNIELMSALDGDRVPSLADKQTEISGRYANSLGPLADRLASEYPELELTPPITLFQVIQFIMSCFDRASELSASRRSTFLKDLSILDSEAGALLGSGELQRVLNDIISHDKEADRRNFAESFKSRPDIDVRAMQNYQQTSRLQLKQRQEALDSFTGWGLDRSHALAAYVDIQRSTIEPIERRLRLIEDILSRVAR
jgi:hypothetical protein